MIWWNRIGRQLTRRRLRPLPRHCKDACKPFPQRRKDLIRNRFVDGMGCDEIAGRLDRPVASVYVAISRIYKKLAECVLQRLSAAGGLNG